MAVFAISFPVDSGAIKPGRPLAWITSSPAMPRVDARSILRQFLLQFNSCDSFRMGKGTVLKMTRYRIRQLVRFSEFAALKPIAFVIARSESFRDATVTSQDKAFSWFARHFPMRPHPMIKTGQPANTVFSFAAAVRIAHSAVMAAFCARYS